MNAQTITNVAFTIALAAVIITAIVVAGMNKRAELRAETERATTARRAS